jgi:AraC-like DNA-binding protein
MNSLNLSNYYDNPDNQLQKHKQGYGTSLATWQVRRLVGFLDGETKPVLRVPELAQVLCLSRCHFSRMFKRTFGISPAAYLTQRRLENAIWMVTHTPTRITDIAADYGFSDQSHFCRIFKKTTGVTPLVWRSRRRVEERLQASTQ